MSQSARPGGREKLAAELDRHLDEDNGEDGLRTLLAAFAEKEGVPY